MLRNPEQAKKREEKRKILRELLPVDLQLRFIQERPEKEKWFFEGELLKRRHSEIYSDDEINCFMRQLKQ
jgi:hypothetical protein